MSKNKEIGTIINNSYNEEAPVEEFIDDNEISNENLAEFSGLGILEHSYYENQKEATTSTPSVSPNISPKSTPRPGSVKSLHAIFEGGEESLEIASRTIASRTRSKVKERKKKRETKIKMSKLEKHKIVLDQLEPTIEQCIQELDVDSREKMKRLEKHCRWIKSRLDNIAKIYR
ncbi:unnamed protein product [Meganyctiphanes norvegica]|uniref:Uncharacterized protein n=1 Tax=Meganyctiphanes norvegica TaxID=48144 RepID=A0AAV2QG76_MEGNR